MRKLAKKQDGRARGQRPRVAPRTNFQMRLTPEQRELYTGEAMNAGVSVAEWLRRAADRAVGRCSLCGRS